MILDTLKQLQEEGNWDAQHLIKINPDDVLKEIQNEYSNLVPINWDIYAAIPQVLIDNFINIDEDSEELQRLKDNIFYEEALLQMLYMQARGIDPVYTVFLLGACNSAKVCNYFYQELEQEDEYKLLHRMYDNYCNKSLSGLAHQTKALENFKGISQKELNDMLDSIKEIVKQEE